MFDPTLIVSSPVLTLTLAFSPATRLTKSLPAPPSIVTFDPLLLIASALAEPVNFLPLTSLARLNE